MMLFKGIGWRHLESTSLLGSGAKSAVFSSSSDALVFWGDLCLSPRICQLRCFNTILILLTPEKGSATQRCLIPRAHDD